MIRAGGEKGGMGCLFSFGFRRYNEFTILLLGRGWAMKPADQTGTLLKGAFALTLAAVVTKILSAVYRVPFQNIVGDIGFYIYQQIYPIYAFALVLSTYGFPVVLSKLYTERKNSGGREDVHRLLVVSGGFIFVICAVFFFILYFGARRLAVLMGDPELAVFNSNGRGRVFARPVYFRTARLFPRKREYDSDRFLPSCRTIHPGCNDIGGLDCAAERGL